MLQKVRQSLGRAVVAVRALAALVAALVVAAVVAAPSYAQGVSANDLTDPVQNGVEGALTAGFVIAAAILVGFAIYKIVKRFA